MTENIENKYYKEYPFELSPWQKNAIQAIINGHNVIVMAPTGSGKTLPAEIAIKHLSKINNKTERNKLIYCSPIKALTNEKKCDFEKKFGDKISIGVRTGDITYCENADLLLCTTEILRNNLPRLATNSNLLDFKMNPEKELAAVIYDEIHNLFYNESRGTVWEESLMDLPKTTQVIGLSATLDNPEKMCNALTKINGKKTILCFTNKRVVPLEHKLLYFIPNAITKKLHGKPKEIVESTYNETNTCSLKKDNQFNTEDYDKFIKLDKLIFNNKPKHYRTNQKYIMNKTAEFLKNQNKLPAIIYVMSRKRCSEYANHITYNILKKDSKIPHTIEKVAKQILINKVVNWEEYVNLPEWKTLIKLLQKGIGVHHSGVIQVFRELIETLFKQKYIYLLFATESMGIGVDMPVKSTVHTSIQKYTKKGQVYFRPDQYIQMAGRAGRRGQDDIGSSYILFNMLRKNPVISGNDLSYMLSGKAQPLYSKFQLNSNLILKLMAQKYSYNSIINYIKKSIYYQEIEEQIKELSPENENYEQLKNYIPETVSNHMKMLTQENFINEVEGENNITLKGEIATIVQEMPTLAMSSFIMSLKKNDKIKYITTRQWIAFFSIFTPIRISDEDKIHSVNEIQSIGDNIKDMIKKFDKTLDYYYRIEIEQLQSGKAEKYSIHYDMCELLYNWSDKDCNVYDVLSEAQYWGISIGDFIKSVQKVCSISKEMEKVAILIENNDLLSTIKEIPKLLLKFVVSNESIYI